MSCEETASRTYTVVTRGGVERYTAEVIHERLVSIFVNGQELATMMCTPCDQDALALGFLANEGIVDSPDEVEVVHVCRSGGCVDVWLARADFEPPRRMILTSGCGGGVTFEDLSGEFEPLPSAITRQATPADLWSLMDQLYQSTDLHSRAGGVHAAGLSDGLRLLLTAEDVGRHNTLDKLRGMALQRGIPTRGTILLTTGRISSEMLNKARRMEVPLICSRTSPTSLSTALAEAWRITLVGYLRRHSMNVYTHPERIRLDGMADHSAAKDGG
jgi:FdhD protein